MIKILRQGSVKITSYQESPQSYIDLAFIYKFYHNSIEGIYIILSGEQKIILKFDTDPNFKNPTKISTGHNWKAYTYSDAIDITITKRTISATVCFFNLNKCKNTMLF